MPITERGISQRTVTPFIQEVRQFKLLLSIFLTFTIIFPSNGFCAKKEDAYLIGREDILDITVWQSPDLTKAVVVRSDGTIDYPLLGSLPAAGLTTANLQKTLQEKLAQGYVKNPQVSVAVKEYNSKKILVFGQVGKPGLYKLRGPIPLLEFLFMVSGVQPDAKRMTVIRPLNISGEATPSALLPSSSEEKERADDSSHAIEVDLIALLSRGDLSQNILIRPGDTIYVSSGTGQKYYVLGQVKSPGPYEWVQDITVLEAIKLADGVTERGAPNRIKVKKNVRGQTQEIKINIVDIMRGKKKDDVVVKPGDTIIVPESWI